MDIPVLKETAIEPVHISPSSMQLDDASTKESAIHEQNGTAAALSITASLPQTELNLVLCKDTMDGSPVSPPSHSSRRSGSSATDDSYESQDSLWTKYSQTRSSHTSFSRNSDISSTNPDPLVFENFIFQKVMPVEDTAAADAAVVFFELLCSASQGRVMLKQRLSMFMGGDLIVRSR
ncbi:hypothetical protein AAP_03335 [Ascosphaera apis ARSEF 7405]|uniref:Uncharacterized protein n=1 Tax=Ascosphaera apis ARSEF 7405 TaxID=392613 RepID=A0A167YQC0_9EURO|nr:hypothetical protein AAP_03335 [Ascosphaera apis ARSEF 7405]